MPDIVIAFFALGLIAGVIKSDLKVPESIYETLTIVLMLTLGLKGGMSLHGQGAELQPLELIGIVSLGFIIPLALYPILNKLVKLSVSDSASIAAHYGSVSAGTFAVVLAMTESIGWELRPETTLYLVLLELPAIVIMLWLHRKLTLRQHASQQPQRNQSQTSTEPVAHGGNILHEALTSRGVVLLLGGVFIGWCYGPVGLEPLAPMLLGGFKTLLALFLLEMGLVTAKVCIPLPLKQWRLLMFAAITPFVLAWVGILTGIAMELPAGSVLVLAGLTASASYIAAPAAIRAAIPDANIGLAMLAALGITFPINVLVGLPIYQHWIAQLML